MNLITPKQKDTEKKVKEFAYIIKKYYNISELNPFILNELIHKIIVHEREIINGKRVQKIEILYKFMIKMYLYLEHLMIIQDRLEQYF